MSAKDFKLEVHKREESGKKASKKVRRDGHIPGVYYSHDSEQSISFSMDKKVLFEAQKSGAHIFNINVGSKKRNVIFKSVQYHPVTDEILHIDLYGVKMDEKITVRVTVELVGTAVGVSNEGGVLNSPTSEIEIECLPMDIPDKIEVDINDLSIGDSISAGGISLDDKFTLMSSEESVIASVTHAMREEKATVTEDGEDMFMDDETTDSNDGGESTDSE
tara:strand:+ start:146 stop:802 length:657 start_codon:yes stop_codon:yes gene_type:complete